MIIDKEKEEAVEWAAKFVEERVKELEGKAPADTMPLKISGIAYASFEKCFGESMFAEMVKPQLFSLVALVAYSTMKFLEQEKETSALDKLMES